MKNVLIAILIAISVTSCCTRGFVADHYRSAVVVRPTQNMAGVEMGVNLFDFKAWWAAAKNNPLGASWNAVLDGVMGWFAVKGGGQVIQQTGLFGEKKKDSSSSGKNNTTINGDGNTVNNQ